MAEHIQYQYHGHEGNKKISYTKLKISSITHSIFLSFVLVKEQNRIFLYCLCNISFVGLVFRQSISTSLKNHRQEPIQKF